MRRRRGRTALLAGRPGRGAVLSPAPGGRLDAGVLVETLLLARVFGARVLRVEGTVWVSPAHLDPAGTDAGDRVVPSSAVERRTPAVVEPRGDTTDRRGVSRTDGSRTGERSGGSGGSAVGAGLADAQRLLEETRSELRGVGSQNGTRPGTEADRRRS